MQHDIKILVNSVKQPVSMLFKEENHILFSLTVKQPCKEVVFLITL